MADDKFEIKRTEILKLAGFTDAHIRFHADSISVSDKEEEFIKNWLLKEKDPLLVVILAQLAGMREMVDENEDGSDKDAD